MAINSIANLTDSTVAGSNTEIQYNNSGVFGASSNLTFDGSTLTVTGDISHSGNYTNTALPAFQVRHTTNLDNVTGDGTAYTVVWSSETFDQGSDFSSTAFTAPVTGKYQLSAAITIYDQLAAGSTTAILNLNTSNRDYYFYYDDVESTNQQTLIVSVLADMDAADTAVVSVSVNGGTKTVDLIGSNPSYNWFSGYLVC